MATSSALEIIPASATCRFVGEGRANLVFTLSLADHDAQDHPALKGHLLRLPKTTAANFSDSKALPYPDLQRYWESRIQPLFLPHELVHQRLVRLPTHDPHFFRALNAQLRQLDASGARRPDFLGHAVNEDVHIGMLVEDMRSTITTTTTTTGTTTATMTMHEIKPKWLHQSPRAPHGAEQCRNCAREVWRNKQNATRKPIFCPLNLVKAADFPTDDAVARDIAGELTRCLGDKMTDTEACTLARWLRGSELFLRLRRIQWDHDHAAHVDDDEAYSLAMTLRDCSLFVLLPSGDAPDAAARVVAKLGDTDMKNFAVKKDYWLKMEKEFHDSGVYWNSDNLSMSLTACQLPFYRARVEAKADSELGRYYLT